MVPGEALQEMQKPVVVEVTLSAPEVQGAVSDGVGSLFKKNGELKVKLGDACRDWRLLSAGRCVEHTDRPKADADDEYQKALGALEA